jgi:hypothetical protein
MDKSMGKPDAEAMERELADRLTSAPLSDNKEQKIKAHMKYAFKPNSIR